MKILLLTDVPPCKEFSGALLTYHLCRYIPSDNIVCVAVRDRHLSEIMTSEDLPLETLYLTKPRENTNWFFGGKIKLFTFFYELYSELFIVPRLIEPIVKFAKKHDVDRIWCVLQGQTTIRLAKLIKMNLSLPLLTQVWDHPVWWMGNNNIDKLTSKRIFRLYNEVLSESKCLGAASFIMAERVVKETGIPSVPLVSSLPKIINEKLLPRNIVLREKIIIGFAGQTYAEQAIENLINFLDSINWKIKEKEVFIRYLGYYINFYGHKKRNIEYLGYREQNETINLLADCDLLFCPYINDPKYSLVYQTSFPAKLTTYLSTGIPVIFIGPADSSPAVFLKDNNAAFVFPELIKEQFHEFLLNILNDNKSYEKMSLNSLVAFNKFLTFDYQEERFIEFLHYADVIT